MATKRKSNNNFRGEIHGKSIYDFTRGLDIRLDLEERLEYVKQLFVNDKTGELEKYFINIFTQRFDLKKESELMDLENSEDVDSVNMENLSFTGANTSAIKLILSKSDSLYTESNICAELSRLADYLIFAMPRDTRVEYKVFKDKDLFKKELKEVKLEYLSNGEKLDEVINILLEKNQNFKLVVNETITDEDLELYPELKDYSIMLQSITKRLKRINLMEAIFKKTKWLKSMDNLTIEDKEKMKDLDLTDKDLNRETYKEMQMSKSLLMKHSALVNQDMLDIKQSKLGTIHFKSPLADSSDVDYDNLDLFQEDQVMALLQVRSGKGNLQRDMDCVMQDLDALIKEANLSELDMKILNMYRREVTLEKIGEKVRMTKQGVEKHIKKIAKYIVNTYNKQYEDNYYLNTVKGKYKTCTKCGEVKLATDTNFAKQQEGKFGFKAQCKECISINKKILNNKIAC